jgi:protein TonB
MTTAAPPAAPASFGSAAQARRMGVALALASLLHALVLIGIGFEMPEPASDTAVPLEVMLVTDPGAGEPDPNAQVAAQADRAGDTDEAIADVPGPPEPVPEPADDATDGMDPLAEEPPLDEVGVAAPAQATEAAPEATPEAAQAPPPEPMPEAVITALEPEPESEPLPEPESAPEPEPEPQELPAVTAADILASRGAEIDRLTTRIETQGTAYASRARRKAISTSTREYRYASYMEAWRRKVQRIGNLNYPEEAARQGLYGNLILHVAIRADGSLERVRIVRSSGQPVLDEAAIKIVELAAPFAPFPPDIRAETDVLDITRVWQFQRNNRLGWEN